MNGAILVGMLLCAQDRIAVDADVPGGNIVVEKIDGDTVTVRQDLRDTEGWWFYWRFRVRGAQGRSLTFKFSSGAPVGVRGAAVSVDRGETWAWQETKPPKGSEFTYRSEERRVGKERKERGAGAASTSSW